MTSRNLDSAKIREWLSRTFTIDLEAGDIVWRVPPHNHPRLRGTSAGSTMRTHSGKQYVVIKRDRLALRRSWLIYLWATGRWPVECIDHINGDSLDDRIQNLRAATVTENAWNHKRRARRIQLPMGVRLTASGRFQARISCNRKQYHLGAFDTVDEAARVYIEKRKDLFGEFA